jgi:hypothetical protein
MDIRQKPRIVHPARSCLAIRIVSLHHSPDEETWRCRGSTDHPDFMAVLYLGTSA